jgi:hypothetical protein
VCHDHDRRILNYPKRQPALFAILNPVDGGETQRIAKYPAGFLEPDTVLA